MTTINPSMRLKVKPDTLYLHDPNGTGVFFRNNEGAFRMEGSTVGQWIDNLFPLFNGEHTLAEITDGLPRPYQERVQEIAETLWQNGFVRDVSQDRPHQLPEAITEAYARQIEFLDQFSGSGAYRFETYRQANVLAVGSGPFLVSLVSALLESGLPTIHVRITDSVQTRKERLAELTAHARRIDPQANVIEVAAQPSWRDVIQPFESVLYVSETGDLKELRELHTLCQEEHKVFVPALCAHDTGMAGPLVCQGADGCWESAWRRVHQSALCKGTEDHMFSTTAGAMLANVLVFEWMVHVTDVAESALSNRFFLMNLETLEGSWHSFLPHPLITGLPDPQAAADVEARIASEVRQHQTRQLLPYFSFLTSAESGIFHQWGERDLNQLPLAVCAVQAVDPLTEGPADLLPETVCADLTHEDVRREAGLVGIEAYVSRTLDLHTASHVLTGVGAGGTVTEALSRGLHTCVTTELNRQLAAGAPVVRPVQAGQIEDERSAFYARSLTLMQGTPPVIGRGADVCGFPVVWVGAGGKWYGSVGWNVTIATRNALCRALLRAQHPSVHGTGDVVEAVSVQMADESPASLMIPPSDWAQLPDVLLSALQSLRQNGYEWTVHDLALEPFLQNELAAVFGVSLQKGDAP